MKARGKLFVLPPDPTKSWESGLKYIKLDHGENCPNRDDDYEKWSVPSCKPGPWVRKYKRYETLADYGIKFGFCSEGNYGFSDTE